MKRMKRRMSWKRYIILAGIAGLCFLLPQKGYAADYEQEKFHVKSRDRYMAVSGREVHGELLSSYEGSEKVVFVPDNIVEIGEEAFMNNEYLEEVILPKSVLGIGDRAFCGCSNLKRIRWVDDIGKEKNQERDILKDGKEKHVEIQTSAIQPKKEGWSIGMELSGSWEHHDPGGYEFYSYEPYIGNSSFDGCGNLEEIVLPKEIKVIGALAFAYCRSLTNMDLPEGVEIIGQRAFTHCSGLSRVKLPENLVYLRKRAFEQCENLEYIDIPEGFKDLGKTSFWGTKWLREKQKENSVVIVNGVLIDGSNVEGSFTVPAETIVIGDDAFGENQKLLEVEIYGRVERIGEDAFRNCSALKRVVLSNGLQKIGYNSFWGCENLESIKIPETVTCIEHNAFINCKKLKKVVIMGEVSIGHTVFSGDIHLKDVIFMKDGKTKVSMGIRVFNGCSKNLKIWVKKRTRMRISTNYDNTEMPIYEIPEKIKLTFVKNGGKKLSKNKMEVSFYTKYGKLPTASRKGYQFDGWYTKKKGGDKITSASRVEEIRAHKLYAHWTKIRMKETELTGIKTISGKVKVKWKKVSGADGYELVWADNKKFKKSEKKSISKTGCIIQKVHMGKKCYVKVRAYKLDSTGKRVYGRYSKVQRMAISR